MRNTDFSRVITAKAAAERTRTEYLIAVSEGLLTVADVVHAACTTEGKPLLKMRLHRILAHQPGWGDARARRTIARLSRTLRVDPEFSITIGWLLDSRTGGHRVQAFADALLPKTVGPWPGFPYSTKGDASGDLA